MGEIVNLVPVINEPGRISEHHFGMSSNALYQMFKMLRFIHPKTIKAVYQYVGLAAVPVSIWDCP